MADSLVEDVPGELAAELGAGDPYTKVACVIRALDMPDRVVNAIDTALGLDGTLEGSWDGLRARWQYPPNNGLSLNIWIAT